MTPPPGHPDTNPGRERAQALLALAIVVLLIGAVVGAAAHSASTSNQVTQGAVVGHGNDRRPSGAPGKGSGATGGGTAAGGGGNGPAGSASVPGPGPTPSSSSPTPTTSSPSSPTTPPPSTAPPTTSRHPAFTIAPVLTGYPTSPPAPICDNKAVLNGPVAPVAGWVAVNSQQNLNDVTQANPTGSTFWLAPGVYRLGTGQYSQVVPKDNDAYLGAPGAVIDGAGVNQYAFTQQAHGVTVKYLTVQNFVSPRDQGVVNHDSGAAWVIENNTFQNNQGASVMVGPGDLVAYNCLRNNGQYGFNAYAAGGDSHVTVDHNEIAGNNTANWEQQVPGCGCTGGGKFWDVAGAVVTNNWVHNNHGPGLWADTDNAGFDIEHNLIADNDGEAIIYEISYNARIANNTMERNALVQGRAKASDTFPIPAIYVSESGGDQRVFGGLYASFEITGNFLQDNWGGITLWENADRFCGSPANTSSTFCTLGGAANLAKCVAGSISSPPLLSDCRWKTQNVSVTNNDFVMSAAATGCNSTGSCGQNAVLSQVGTSPSWSPYKGDTVQKAITFSQNNHFSGNRYRGPWRFAGFETGQLLPLGAWQAAPYNQDGGSSLAAV